MKFFYMYLILLLVLAKQSFSQSNPQNPGLYTVPLPKNLPTPQQVIASNTNGIRSDLVKKPLPLDIPTPEQVQKKNKLVQGLKNLRTSIDKLILKNCNFPVNDYYLDLNISDISIEIKSKFPTNILPKAKLNHSDINCNSLKELINNLIERTVVKYKDLFKKLEYNYVLTFNTAELQSTMTISEQSRIYYASSDICRASGCTGACALQSSGNFKGMYECEGLGFKPSASGQSSGVGLIQTPLPDAFGLAPGIEMPSAPQATSLTGSANESVKLTRPGSDPKVR